MKKYIRVFYRNFSASNPLTGKLTLDQLKFEIKKGNIDTILAGTVDTWGRAMTKTYDAEYFLKNFDKPVLICCVLFVTDFYCNPVGFSHYVQDNHGFKNTYTKLDFNTIRKIGWLEKTAGILGNVYDEEGNLWDAGPRSLLQKSLDKAKKQGYKDTTTASELEYFLFEGTYQDIFDKGYNNLTPYTNFTSECSPQDIFKVTEYHRELREAFRQSAIGVTMHKGEAGVGQDEINLEHCSIMEQADQHVWFKFAVKHVAQKHGMTATFMAKPYSDKIGNGCHFHINLVNEKGNAFAGNDWQIRPKVTASNDLKYFLGGWMKYFNDTFVLYAPTINSYKRLIPNNSAPSSNTWGYDNRTASFRICGSDNKIRIENRIAGADCNPYLAYAAALESGLKGIKEKIEPPKESIGNVYTTKDPSQALPRNLHQAVKNLQDSKIAQEFFGKECAEHYAAVFKGEGDRINNMVSIQERLRYFEQI